MPDNYVVISKESLPSEESPRKLVNDVFISIYFGSWCPK